AIMARVDAEATIGRQNDRSQVRPRTDWELPMANHRLISGLAMLLGMMASSLPGADSSDALLQRAKQVLAQLDGEIRTAGLQEPVEVLRDTWGVPHIYARNQQDLFFAQGFVTAQDRLFQIDFWRRIGQGATA